ncbi:YozE family protein [Lederbergia sp. NSJ-179]|uniref:YozE family protein n=1 Tax=Lederbergia sp. NSJ-179 TaxID=2931402 RepID=UPI001FD2C843|nr:YozE family protein [Lederbergia sp. NSJ-179]MCJ7841147.1 YozE family protein [Lederbergia sp. NSJ-179]
MKKSFYQFLMKFRQAKAKDEISQFANNAYQDHSFPKHSSDYHELSNYLELHVDYLPTVSLFDHVWELYIESEK